MCCPAGGRWQVETSPFIDQLKKVELPDGNARLWNPDLAPYDHKVVSTQRLETQRSGDFIPT